MAGSLNEKNTANDSHIIDESAFRGEDESPLLAALGEEDKDQLAEEDIIAIDWARLDSFGESLAKHRSECISYRQSSGIEKIWLEDEEHYEGVDDRNRGEESRTSWNQKPPGQSSTSSAAPSTKSTVFPNITSPFVDSGTARLADVILPMSGDPSFSFKPTPIPDLIDAAAGNFAEVPDINYEDPDAVMAQAGLEDAEMEEAKRIIKEAKDTARRAEQCIFDWHIECKRRKSLRKVIDDSGRIGVGILRGPYNKKIKRIGYFDGKVKVIEKVIPASAWVDPWNFYPAPDCGEDIQSGDGTWEREYVTKNDLRKLKEDEAYISDQIDRCLREGPMIAQAEYKDTPDPNNEQSDQRIKGGKFEMWRWHGTAEAENLEAAGCSCDGYEDPYLPGQVIMVNNHPIMVEMNNMETGKYPYSVFRWKRRAGHWAGIGISRMVRVPQKIVVGATRNLMDNAGLAAGPMIVFKQGSIVPADGIAGIGPRKVFYIAEDDEVIQDARAAIGVIQVDMVVDDLLKIVQFGLQMAEETSGMPMLLQGQMGGAPDTVGGMRMLTNNAAPPLRRLARAFDQDITENETEMYYEYLLLYGPDNCKGDFFINSNGSSTLVERDIQDQELGAMGAIVIDPRFGLSPDKWSKEYLKSRRFDPSVFETDEESDEYQAMVQKSQQFDELEGDPRVQSMMMDSETKRMKVQTDGQLGQMKVQSTDQLGQMKLQTEAETKVWQRQQDQMEMEANAQIQLLINSMNDEQFKAKSAQERQNHVEKLQTEISTLVAKLKSQERLAGMGATSDRMPMTPVVEPPQQAPAGESVQQ